MAKYFLFLLTLFPLGVFSQDCDCPLTGDLDEIKKTANVIFIGRVLEVQTNWVSSGMKYTFQVERSWVRSIEPTVTINSPSPGNCGFPFIEGNSYLVFVNKKFSLTTTICDHNVPLDQADGLIERLGPGQEPSASPGSAKMMWLMLILTVVGLIFVGVVVFSGKFFRKKQNEQ